MMLNRLNHRLGLGFLFGLADLKKNVFINVRKQIVQKMEGINACQL